MGRVLLIIIALGFVAGIIIARSYVAGLKEKARPGRDMIQALSLIEQMLAVDEVQPVIPARLRVEAEAFMVTQRKKEMK